MKLINKNKHFIIPVYDTCVCGEAMVRNAPHEKARGPVRV